MSEKDIVKQRTEKFVRAIKSNYDYVSYAILAIIVLISIRIRTANLAGLRDVTTGGWTLGPDLDPFLFLRWGRYIVENGSLMTVDTLRYIPLGLNTLNELVGLPYLIAWFHSIATMFGSTSIDQSAALLPVPLFALTVIAFFFMVRLLFSDLGKTPSNTIALIASFFLSVLPVLLPRTIAGIPEKESAAFLFMFLAFYLFLYAWKTNRKSLWITTSLLSGIATACMAATWGGYNYVFITLAAFMFILLLTGNVHKKHLGVYGIWLVASLLLMTQLSTRYTLGGMITSLIIGGSILVFVMAAFRIALDYMPSVKAYIQNKTLKNVPLEVKAILLVVIAAIIIVTILLGPSFILDRVIEVQRIIFTPIVDRLGITVAENRQPFLDEWAGSFGPTLGDFFRFISLGAVTSSPAFFSSFYIILLLFIIGSVWMFYSYLPAFSKREKLILTVSFFAFILGTIYNRKSASSILNGESFLSTFIYIGGILLFVCASLYVYYKNHRRGNHDVLRSLKPVLVFMIIFIFISLLSARGAVRLIMVLVPAASIFTAYAVVRLFYLYRNSPKKTNKRTTWGVIFLIAAILVIFAGYFFYATSYATAQSYVPSSYTQQWQKSMSWVRENTSQDAVFAHWWDYGYWVQSIGERATVLDGGNYFPYWNHLMGRHTLTGSDRQEALTWLYTHNVTHFLIDSTDIGKYPAFASIGSNESYDRRSWIDTFVIDMQQTTETKNSTAFLYRGQAILDEDVQYQSNGTMTLLPGVGDRDTETLQNIAAVGAIRVDFSKEDGSVEQPTGYFLYQGRQYLIPLRYAYYNGTLHDFASGLDAGVFIFPSVSIEGGTQVSLNDKGALLYLSKRTVHSQLARLYLFGEEDSSFKVANIQDSSIVEALRNAGVPVEHFVYYQGLQGPITIWEVSYPSTVRANPAYLETSFPTNEIKEDSQ